MHVSNITYQQSARDKSIFSTMEDADTEKEVKNNKNTKNMNDTDVMTLEEGTKTKEEYATQARKIGSHAWCLYRGDNSWRDCEIIHLSQKITGMIEKYYVHFIEFNRRMDKWVGVEALKDIHPTDPSRSLTSGHLQPFSIYDKIKHRGSNVVEFVEEDYGDETKIDLNSIMEHEEVTKIKNVNSIELGRYLIDTWYFSPVPKEFYPKGNIETLHLCAFCLNLYGHPNELARHYKKCKWRSPPGDEIYRDTEHRVSMFEIDGAVYKFYCQNLSYLVLQSISHSPSFSLSLSL